jgi:hypothetical protein
MKALKLSVLASFAYLAIMAGVLSLDEGSEILSTETEESVILNPVNNPIVVPVTETASFNTAPRSGGPCVTKSPEKVVAKAVPAKTVSKSKSSIDKKVEVVESVDETSSSYGYVQGVGAASLDEE